MTFKKGFLVLSSVLWSGTFLSASAVVFPDQLVQVAIEAEEESPDATSRFGADTNANKRNHASVAIPLHPIDESSFEQEVSRGPASVGGRGPAAVKTSKSNALKQASAAVAKRAKSQRAFQEVALIANELGFFPSTLFLTQGIPVRLYVTGASAKSQCFILDQFGVRRQVRNQKIEEITFTPDQTGTFSFTCPMNGAKGTVVVKEIEVNGRVPANLSVSHAPQTVPIVEQKKSDIQNEDFSPEFRND